MLRAGYVGCAGVGQTNAKQIFWQTSIVTWMNNIIDMHSGLEKSLFWGSIRKEGYSLFDG